MPLHAVLQRQLRRFGLDEATPCASLEDWQALLARISRAYTEADQERYTLERSITVSSGEMLGLHATLSAERDKLQAVIQSLGDGLCVLDEAGRIRFVNHEGERVFGAPSAALVGRVLNETLALSTPATDAPPAVRALTLGEAVRSDEAVLRRPDGREVPVAFVVTPIRGDSSTHGAVLAIRDISERKQLELSLRHAQKLESVGRLAAGIAHEINTPIQFVGDNARFLDTTFTELRALRGRYRAALTQCGCAPALLDELRAAEAAIDVEYLDAEVPRAIEQTLEGVTRVATIVQAMKAFAHPDQREQAPADLNQALLTTLTVARNEIKYVADVETDLGELPAVMCHVGDLNQVFLNLLVNAAHTIADVVGDTGARGVIRVRTRSLGATVEVAIADTGAGIPDDVAPKIFDPFFTTKQVGRGTGQGLAIGRSVVVEKHGGTLTFETAAGRGTTFFIRLPVRGLRPSQRPRTSGPHPRAGARP